MHSQHSCPGTDAQSTQISWQYYTVTHRLPGTDSQFTSLFRANKFTGENITAVTQTGLVGAQGAGMQNSTSSRGHNDKGLIYFRPFLGVADESPASIGLNLPPYTAGRATHGSGGVPPLPTARLHQLLSALQWPL